MADILKISTPLLPKNTIQFIKQSTDPTVPFQLNDVQKVIKPQAQSELLSQNSGASIRDEAPTILTSLLKDPMVTVSFLKNIYLLQEMISLLPVNNNTVTKEIQELFEQLLITQDKIVPELIRQENASTRFKGGLYDFLRKLSFSSSSPDVKFGIANLLKALNGTLLKKDILDSVSNSLMFLSKELTASPILGKQIYLLAEQFRQNDAADRFSDLKQKTLSLLHDVEGSILFSAKIAKVVPIIIYNLSRFQDNPDFLRESISHLLSAIESRENRSELVAWLKEFHEFDPKCQTIDNHSKVMKILADIISKEADEPASSLINSEKIENIINSLLSSPCNFTPLLHFVMPVRYEGLRSFAELWIDPKHEEKPGLSKDDFCKNIHVFIVFDIEGIGQFEAEVLLNNETIDFNLLCPPEHVQAMTACRQGFLQAINGSGYHIGEVRINQMEHIRSLMDVFKSLPYKRTGVNVKI